MTKASLRSIKMKDDVRIVEWVSEDGDSWHQWIVARSKEKAWLHAEGEHYSGPGQSFAGRAVHIPHPKWYVLWQRGGLDI